MPGQDARHHGQAGAGVALGPAGHWFQSGGRSPVSQFLSLRWLLGLIRFTEPGFESGIFKGLFTELGHLYNAPLF